MTRFARAKGSKSSNERLPENPTPWHEMKKQLERKNAEPEENKKRAQAEAERVKNYNNFLREREEKAVKDVKWAEFPGVKKKRVEKLKQKKKLGKAVKRFVDEDDDFDEDDVDDDDDDGGEFDFWKSRLDDALRKVGIGEEVVDGGKKKGKKIQNEEFVAGNKKQKLMKSMSLVDVKKKKHVFQSDFDANLEDESNGKLNGENVMSDSDDEAPDEISAKVAISEPVVKQVKAPKKTPLKIPSVVQVKNESEKNETPKKSKTPKNNVNQVANVSQVDDEGKEKLRKKNKLETPKKLKTEKKNENQVTNHSQLKDKEIEELRKKKKLERRRLQREKVKTIVMEMKNKNLEELSPEEREKFLKIKRRFDKVQSRNEKKKAEYRAKMEAKNAKRDKKAEKVPNEVVTTVNDEDKQNCANENLDNAKKTKNKKPKEIGVNDNSGEETNAVKAEKKKLRALKRKEKKLLKKEATSTQTDTKQLKRKIETDNPETPTKKSKLTTHQKVDKKQNKKSKLQNQPQKPKPNTYILNGKKIEIGYIQGFPILKDDADRIGQLEKDLRAKGIPKSEIETTLKLERRRAEKKFAREKKNVCLYCREPGHLLSQCPSLNKGSEVQTAGTGICFKCGSTEHTHFECKVVKGAEYKFAQCFICKEQGHISKQCPDNPKGVYPKGGGCRVCGDVTHLKKDCPELREKKEGVILKGETIDEGNLEDLDLEKNKEGFNNGERKKNKIVKF